MPRYFFDTANGDNNTDESGIDLLDEIAAIREAVQFAGAMLQHQPEILSARRAFHVSVRKGEDELVAHIRVELVKE
jgi:hypothetical protein